MWDLAGTQDVWVEFAQHGTDFLFLESRDTTTGAVLSSDLIVFFTFTSIVIALGGNGQVPIDSTNDPNLGAFVIGTQLYDEAYDVHMFQESDVADGSGPVYNEVVSAIQRRSVTHVAIFGYSQGGGATWVLANALNSRRATIGTFTIDLTGYIDAVRHTFQNPEDRTPPGSLHHANYWQDHPSGVLRLHGASVPGSHPDLNVRTTAWGASLDHFTIDDHRNVRDGMKTEVHDNVPR